MRLTARSRSSPRRNRPERGMTHCTSLPQQDDGPMMTGPAQLSARTLLATVSDGEVGAMQRPLAAGLQLLLQPALFHVIDEKEWARAEGRG